MRIGFIGLGRMGLAMARNLAKAGHEIRAWNRSPIEPDAIPGADLVASPAEVFQAETVFTMLSDDAAIREVILQRDLLKDARPALVHVVTATISIAFADELAAIHARAGLGYVSAPVFGRPDVAEAAQLNIMAAGAQDALDRVRPLLDAIGQRVFVMGDQPRQANAAKIAGNMMIAMAIEGLAEAMALTEGEGVAREAFLELMLQTQFGCRAYQNYGRKILSGDFEAGFRLALGLKDLRLAGTAGERSRKRLPMLDALETQMARAADAGLAERDWSAVAQFRLSGGLPAT